MSRLSRIVACQPHALSESLVVVLPERVSRPCPASYQLNI